MGTLGEADMAAVFRTEYVKGEWAALAMGRDAVGGFDANGDGHTDVAVAAPGASVAIGTELGTYVGAVYILYGPRCGPHDPLAYDAVIRGVSERYAFGGRMAPVGDLDGDGWDDLAISAPGEFEGAFDSDFKTGNLHWSADHGRVVFGPFEGEVPIDDAHALTLETPAVDLYGTYDLTGDGVRDMMASGLLYPAPVSRGSLADGDARTEVLLDGDYEIDRYGPTPVHDMDGDGIADLLVQGGVMSGPLVSGVLSSADADRQIVGVQEREQYRSTADIGDVDGDGAGDLVLVVGTGYDYYLVGLSGVNLDIQDALFQLAPTSMLEQGYLVAQNRPIDLDADGVAEVVLGFGLDRTDLGIWYGPSSGTLDMASADVRVPLTEPGLWLSSIAYAGDQDGDGFEDLLLGWSTEQELANSEAWLLLGGPQ
jgi:hypothetical protein